MENGSNRFVAEVSGGRDSIERELEAALEARNSKELLRLCAQVDANIQLTVLGFTESLVHWVAQCQVSLQCLRLLIKKLGPGCLICRNKSNETPVHLAAWNKDESWMLVVCDSLGKDSFRVTDYIGWTTAHYAARNKNCNSSLKFVAKELGGDCLTVPDNNGDTAVHFAALCQSADSLQFLFEHIGPRMFSLENKAGQTLADMVEQDSAASRKFGKRAWMSSKQQLLTAPPHPMPPAQPHGNQRPSSPPFFLRWDSVKFIGRGGFGEVHEVLTDKGIRCAAKTIKLPMHPGDQLDHSKMLKINRAVESEKNLCLLSHENIVRFLHIIAQPESVTVVLLMELLDGRSLERFLDSKPLDEATMRKFCKQICSALHYMHSRQPPVIHRDINCSNIMVLSDSRRIKVIDFGLSIKLEQSVSHFSASAATPQGTLNFMAPELLAPDETDSVMYSRESDVWAFGCTVFQMASGERPYAKARNFFQMAKRLEELGAPEFPAGYSAALQDFYSCCTARDRRMRQSAEELLKMGFLNEDSL